MRFRGSSPQARRVAPAGRRPPVPRARRGPAARPTNAARPPAKPFALPKIAGVHLGRPRITAARAGALLALLASVGLAYGALTSSAFAVRATDMPALHWTSHDALVAAVRVPMGQNVFRVATAPIEDRIRALPAVASAHVSVALPDRLVVAVIERTPIVAWRVGDQRFLVDKDGTVFATASAEGVSQAGVPTVVDQRATATSAVAVGGRIDPPDLDAASRLASLTPHDVGSVATALFVSISDQNGFVVRTAPASWTAVFGFYTPSLRTTELIPGQVRLLRSLLDGREGAVARVILADDRNGTYVPKPTATVAP